MTNLQSTLRLEPLSQWTGCLHRPLGPPAGAKLGPPPTGEIVERAWFAECVPTINQDGPSCCGQAWANWMELMIRRYLGRQALPDGMQLDGHAIWKRGREMFWPNLSGGLYLDQGFRAALDMGILPPGSDLIMVLDLPSIISAALAETPLVQAHRVHVGWFAPNPDNGCLDHLPLSLENLEGHATLRIGLHTRQNEIFYSFQNSWGAAWGWHGIGLIEMAHSRVTRMDTMVYTARLPQGWESWPGWKKYLTKESV